ncbi:hypothetical protein [Actinophytocola sediminis]
MGNGNDEFVNALLDDLTSARDRGDNAEVSRLLNYATQEAGRDVAAVLRERLNLRYPPAPPRAPETPPPEVRRPEPAIMLPPASNNRRVLLVFSAAITVLVAVVVLLVVVIITRTSTSTTTLTTTLTPAPTVVPSARPPSRTQPSATPPAAEYTVAIDRQPITLGAPNVSCQMTLADLDTGSVRVNSTSEDTDDLLYSHCSPIGLQRWNAQYVGHAPSPVTDDPQQCAQHARGDAVSGSIEPADLHRGQSFCVVTDEDNIAALTLTDKPRSSGDDPDLRFELTVWKPGQSD